MKNNEGRIETAAGKGAAQVVKALIPREAEADPEAETEADEVEWSGKLWDREVEEELWE